MAPKALSKEEIEKRFNRQINFYYMRHMWQLVCGRSKWNDDDTIYNALNIRRERYTRVIDSGIIRYGKGELDYLVETTGLPKEIFTGEIRFACKYSTRRGMITISDDEWQALFTWRNKRQELWAKKEQAKKDKAEDDEIKKHEAIYNRLAKNTQHEKRIQELLERVKKAEAENDDFKRLCYFMEKREAAPETPPEEELARFEKTVNALRFDTLDKCPIKALDRVNKLLKEKSNLINSIITYKKAKARKKKT